MVKYLGVDYLQKELDKRKKFLQDAVLTVPTHLNLVEEYPHTGKLCDNRYRQPWNRASADNIFLKNEAVGYKADLNQLTEGVVEKSIELYGSEKTLTCAGNFELCLASPISACSSCDLFNSQGCISESSEEKDTCDNETFQEVDLSSFVSATCTDPRLEETICDNFLHQNVKALPELHTLCSQINLKQVEDPLNKASKSLFASLESIGYEENHLELENETLKESIQPYVLSDYLLREDQKYIEDYLLPTPAKGVITDNVFKLFDVPPVEPDDVDPKEKQGADELMEHLSVPNLPLEIFEDKNCDNSLSILAFKDLIAQDMYILDMWHMSSSLEPNMERGNFGFSLLDKYIESPITDMEREFTVQKFQSDEELQPFSEDNSIHNYQLLTQTEREKFRKVFWEHEKFMCDLLPLRLPEPDANSTIDYSWISHSQILKQCTQFDVCSINLTQLEMDLQWDPFFDMHLKSDKSIEIIQLDFTPEDMDKIKCEKEICRDTLVKFSSVQLHGWQDEYLKDTETQSMAFLSSKVERNCSLMKRPSTSVGKENTKSSFIPQKFGSDSVNLFLMMRSSASLPDFGQNSKANVESPTKCQIKSPQPWREKERTKSDDGYPLPLKTKRKPKAKIVIYEFREEYLLMLQQIQDTAEPFLSSLKASGELPYQSFSDLMTDVTRFLLKQKEKSISDEPGREPEGYHSAIILHILCCARDSLIHGCLESAITTIRIMLDKYNKDLGTQLTSLSQKLLQNILELQKSKVYHPKMATIMCHLHKHLNRKHSSPDLQSEQKILLILKRDLPGLKEYLIDVLCTISSIKAKYQQNCGSEHVMHSLDSSNCLILLGAQIKSDFPWSQFSFVVEYERDDETFEELCIRQNIRYLSFKIKKDSIIDKTDLEKDLQQAELSSPVEKNALTVIGSAKITGNTWLLQLLEMRHNLIIIERNYSFYVKDIPFPDVEINETTCIVLSHLEQFCQTSSVEPLIRYIVKLSNKYQSCWILIHVHDKSNRYPFSGNTIESLQRLFATVDNFSTSMSSFDVKVMICTSISETATLVRRICDISMKSTYSLTEEDNYLRPWLTESMTPTELLLLHFPSINSVSAMMMASKMSVQELFHKDVLLLSKAFPSIPVKFLKSFVDLVKSSDGTIPRFHFPDAACKKNLTFSSDTNSKGTTPCQLDISNKEKSPSPFFPEESNDTSMKYTSLPTMFGTVREMDISKGNKDSTLLPSTLSNRVRSIWPGIDHAEGKAKRNHLDDTVKCTSNGSLNLPYQNDVEIMPGCLYRKSDVTTASDKSLETPSVGDTKITKEIEAKVIQRFVEREKRKTGSIMNAPDFVQNLEKLTEQQHCSNKELIKEGVSKGNVDIPSNKLSELSANDDRSVDSFQEAAFENKDFNSNLKETTRYILKWASNQKNPSVPSMTESLLKRNIGLAQPQRRMQPSISKGKAHVPRVEQCRSVKNVHQGTQGRNTSGIHNENMSSGYQADILTMPNQRQQLQKSFSGIPVCHHTLYNPSTGACHLNVGLNPQVQACECHQMNSALHMLHGQRLNMEDTRYGMHCCNRGWSIPTSLHAPSFQLIQQSQSYENNEEQNINHATTTSQHYMDSPPFNVSPTRFQDNKMMINHLHWDEPMEQGSRTLWNSYESPPMDLDDQIEPSPISLKSAHQGKEIIETCNRSIFCSTPSINKKKLKYEKDPYSKGGQTKLVFSH